MHLGMIPCCLAMPPKNGQRRSLISGLRIATLSFVVKMQWIFNEQKVLAKQTFCTTKFTRNNLLYLCFFILLPFNRPSGTDRLFLGLTGAKAPAYHHRVPPGRLRSRRLALGAPRCSRAFSDLAPPFETPKASAFAKLPHRALCSGCFGGQLGAVPFE
jgi:hypothetical protein